MPGVIIPETMQVEALPGIWSPVQWELSEAERRRELEDQAQASLLTAVDTPEAVLRMLLEETAIERVFGPPAGYQAGQQGDWDDSLVTFAFKRPIKLESIERTPESLALTYKLEGAGYWSLEIRPERVVIERV